MLANQPVAATSVDEVVRAVRRLPADRLPYVLQFVEFQLAQMSDNDSEDEALWQAVEANQQRQLNHPGESLEEFVDGDAFLADMAKG